MADIALLDAEAIRRAQAAHGTLRERDLAARLGIGEAQLLAARAGQGVTRIAASPDRVMPLLEGLGELMALTRNESCVIEKTGVFANYQSGAHAAMVVNGEIDLRLFPRHWVHGFAVEKPLADGGIRRSLQFFDAAGDAVFKVFLRDEARLGGWQSAVAALRLEDQSDSVALAPRSPVEGARGRPEQAEALRAGWESLSDTHQFLQMLRNHKLNRLGAYRIAGAPYARPLDRGAVAALLAQAAEAALPVMVFAGNMGCIGIHTGPVRRLKPMGPWINVLDPRFNLHLRGDHIAEVWHVTKPTRRGDAVSVEAFGSDGLLIVQIFGVLADPEAAAGWRSMVQALETAAAAPQTEELA